MFSHLAVGAAGISRSDGLERLCFTKKSANNFQSLAKLNQHNTFHLVKSLFFFYPLLVKNVKKDSPVYWKHYW